MADKCTLVRTEKESACLKTDTGCFMHSRNVDTYWCVTDAPPGTKAEGYERKVYSDWSNSGSACNCTPWQPEGPAA